MNQLLQSQFLTAWFVDGYIVNVFGTVFKCGGGCAFTATPFSLIVAHIWPMAQQAQFWVNLTVALCLGRLSFLLLEFLMNKPFISFIHYRCISISCVQPSNVSCANKLWSSVFEAQKPSFFIFLFFFWVKKAQPFEKTEQMKVPPN